MDSKSGIDKLFVSVYNNDALTNNLSFYLQRNPKMSQYNLSQFIKLWAQEKVTTEQAIGQILLQLQSITERVKAVEQQLRYTGAASSGESEKE